MPGSEASVGAVKVLRVTSMPAGPGLLGAHAVAAASATRMDQSRGQTMPATNKLRVFTFKPIVFSSRDDLSHARMAVQVVSDLQVEYGQVDQSGPRLSAEAVLEVSAVSVRRGELQPWSPKAPAGNVCAMRKTPRINWMFTVDRARVKLRRPYPMPADQPVQAAD
jgi:hypothetical protein